MSQATREIQATIIDGEVAGDAPSRATDPGPDVFDEPRPGYGLGSGLLAGLFVGVLTAPVVMLVTTVWAALVTMRSGIEVDAVAVVELAWVLVVLQAAPAIPAWSAVGALSGLVLGATPDHLRRSATVFAIAAAVGAFGGALAGVTWYADGITMEVVTIGAVAGVAIAVLLEWRDR